VRVHRLADAAGFGRKFDECIGAADVGGEQMTDVHS
jgi:hypothetical protein